MFKAPEALEEGNHKKCDLWSIGVLIYYLFFLRCFRISHISKLYENGFYKKLSDNDLKDLVTKLIVIKPEKRMNWEEYFSHNFFKKYQ